MYSQANLINKWILTLLCISLMGCGSSASFDTPKELKDTTPPRVVSSYPDEESSGNFEVDFKVEIIFSELMNAKSLIDEESVKLFSGRKEQNSGDLEQRELAITLTEVPITATDLITDKEIEVPATKLYLTMPGGRFSLNTEYTVEVGSPARDLVEDDLETAVDERNYLESTSTFDFVTEKGLWILDQEKHYPEVPNFAVEVDSSNVEQVVTQNNNQYTPLTISNTLGDNFVLWRQEIMPGINQLWGTRYRANETPANKWSLFDASRSICLESVCANAEQINIIDSSNVIELHAAVNQKGQVAVVWSQAEQSGGLVSIWARLYDGTAWLDIKEVSKTTLLRTDNADSPQVAIDQEGNVVTVWREHEGENSRIKTNIYQLNSDLILANGSWSDEPIYIDDLSDIPRNPPKVALSKSGLAIAVWAEKTVDEFHIYSNRIKLSNNGILNWLDHPERIDNTTRGGQSSSPAIAIDSNNDAIAIWLTHDGQRNNLWYNRFAGSWGAEASLLERNRLGDALFPSITFSRDNRALVSWIQEDKTQTNNSRTLLTSFFDVDASSSGWENEVELASSSTLAKPSAAFDREGNAVLIWQDGLTKGKVKASYYSKLTKSWAESDRSINLSDLGNDISITPLFDDGRFLSVWQETSGSDFKLKSALYSD